MSPTTPAPAAQKTCGGCTREPLRTYCCRNCWEAATNSYDLPEHTPGCDHQTYSRKAEKEAKAMRDAK